MRLRGMGLVGCLVLGLANAPGAHAFPARFGVSPDNSQQLLLSAIGSARASLLINIYELGNQDITDAILAKIRQGLAVRILAESAPAGGLPADSAGAIGQFRAAIAASRGHGSSIVIMARADSGEPRRFVYDHAKYVVIDGTRALISSENFSSTGHPSAGTVGNRGWETLLDDAAVAASLTSMFDEDADPARSDIARPAAGDFPPNRHETGPGRVRRVPALPLAQGEVGAAELVLSPDSLRGIAGMIGAAKARLEVEEMSLPSRWRGDQEGVNPIVGAIVDAARRGAAVRVLLNDDHVFARMAQEVPPGAKARPTANEITVDYLNQLARCENLPLAARVVSVKGAEITYIHNKGMLADGQVAWVGSINGTQNSVMNNREVAVKLKSADAAEYYGGAFDFDWGKSPEAEVAFAADCPQAARPVSFLPAELFQN